jgi:glycosyltransferase involved in cell wall biosynthesis
MKIAYLSTFYPYRGGIAQFNAALYKQLEAQNETRAFTFSLQYPKLLFPGKTQLVQPNDKTDIISAERIVNTLNPFSYIRSASKINKFAPDVLLTKFWMPYFAPSLGYISGRMKQRTKSIGILDNVIPHELRYGDLSFINYYLSRNDGFVVMSESVKKDLLRLKPDAKYILHPHPLYDHFGYKLQKREARAQLSLPGDKKIILFYGFIRDYKGLDLAIQALSKLGNDYHLVIAGEVYGSFDKYSNLIDELNLRNRVSIFTRYITDAETSFFFSAADVCLLPYKSATQSGIIAISYHFDLPVIATNVGGLSEMIEPYSTGLLADKANPKSIADTINQYFAHNSKDWVSNIHNYKKIATWKSLADSIINFAGELR